MITAHANRYLAPLLDGLPLRDVLVIDSHAHYGRWACMNVCWPEDDTLIQQMDRLGIAKTLVNGVLDPDVRAGNDHVAGMMKAYPGRIVGLAVVNPFCQGEIVPELRRCFDDLGFVGIKIHEFVQTLPMSSSYSPKFLEPIYEFAATRGCPILYHGLVTESAIRDHPKVNFICAHGPAYIDSMLELARYDNFHCDTAYTITLRGTFERLAARLGADRVLFGSDVPVSSPAVRLAQLAADRLGDDDMAKILGGNAARLYGIRKSGRSGSSPWKGEGG